MKGHYEDGGIDKKTMHALKAGKLASDVSIVADSITNPIITANQICILLLLWQWLIFMSISDCLQTRFRTRTWRIQLPSYAHTRLPKPKETGATQRCKLRQKKCIFVLFSALKLFIMYLYVWLQKNYRQHIDQVKYKPVTDTPDIILAKKNAQLVSNVSKNYFCDLTDPTTWPLVRRSGIRLTPCGIMWNCTVNV